MSQQSQLSQLRARAAASVPDFKNACSEALLQQLLIEARVQTALLFRLVQHFDPEPRAAQAPAQPVMNAGRDVGLTCCW